MNQETFQIYTRDYICMSIALAVAAEYIAGYTGYPIEDVALNLNKEANRRMAKLPQEAESEIINSYFLVKETNSPVTITTITPHKS